MVVPAWTSPGSLHARLFFLTNFRTQFVTQYSSTDDGLKKSLDSWNWSGVHRGLHGATCAIGCCIMAASGKSDASELDVGGSAAASCRRFQRGRNGTLLARCIAVTLAGLSRKWCCWVLTCSYTATPYSIVGDRHCIGCMVCDGVCSRCEPCDARIPHKRRLELSDLVDFQLAVGSLGRPSTWKC